MKRFHSFLLLICLSFRAVDNAGNYCSSDLCPNGSKHIACGNTGKFSSRCPGNAKMVSMSRYKRTILNMHNSKRNLIASGRLGGYNSAKRMASMQWDNELALMASYNVKQCQMRHDKCRNTRKFSKSGQNLAMISYSGPEKSKSNSRLVKNRVNAWWNEYKVCNSRYIRKYPRNYSGPDIGHFTVFVAEKNIRLGCAAVRFKTGRNNHFILGCNYATTNIVGEPIYRSGTTASSCKTGRHSVYTSLCSKREKYSDL